jgi:hypothetical protein
MENILLKLSEKLKKYNNKFFTELAKGNVNNDLGMISKHGYKNELKESLIFFKKIDKLFLENKKEYILNLEKYNI